MISGLLNVHSDRHSYNIKVGDIEMPGGPYEYASEVSIFCWFWNTWDSFETSLDDSFLTSFEAVANVCIIIASIRPVPLGATMEIGKERWFPRSESIPRNSSRVTSWSIIVYVQTH